MQSVFVPMSQASVGTYCCMHLHFYQQQARPTLLCHDFRHQDSRLGGGREIKDETEAYSSNVVPAEKT